jgi:hypothetical protein
VSKCSVAESREQERAMSLPLAIVLALTPPAPPPILQPPPVEWRLAPKACQDIDPAIVRYVAPPPGKGPIWPIEQLPPRPPGPSFDAQNLDFGPALKGRGALRLRPFACPRLMPAGDGR